MELFFKTGSAVATQRAFRSKRNRRDTPTRDTINRLVKLFRETGSVADAQRRRQRVSPTPARVTVVSTRWCYEDTAKKTAKKTKTLFLISSVQFLHQSYFEGR